MDNINIKTVNTIRYHGNVTVELVRDGKVIKTIRKHNAATQHLFKFIYDCLAGNYYQDERPSYVVPLIAVGENYQLYNDTYTPVTKVVVEDNGTVVTYKCLIGYNTLEDGKAVAGLGFYAAKNRNVDIIGSNISNESMMVAFDNPYVPSSNNKSDLLITWQIKIEDAGIIETE